MPAVKARLDELYRAELASAWQLARFVCGCDSDAEDVVQAVFADLVSGHLQLPPDLQDSRQERVWLLGVVRNYARNRVRWRRRRREQVASLEELDTSAAPRADSEELQRAGTVRHCLAQLDEPYRTAMYLRYVCGLSQAEVAAGMQARPGTVAAWLSRGRDRLQEKLRRYGITAAILALCWPRLTAAEAPAAVRQRLESARQAGWPSPAAFGDGLRSSAAGSRGRPTSLPSVGLIGAGLGLLILAVVAWHWRRAAAPAAPVQESPQLIATASQAPVKESPQLFAAAPAAPVQKSMKLFVATPAEIQSVPAAPAAPPALLPEYQLLSVPLADGGVLPCHRYAPPAARQAAAGGRLPMLLLSPYAPGDAQAAMQCLKQFGPAFLAADHLIYIPQQRPEHQLVSGDGYADLRQCFDWLLAHEARIDPTRVYLAGASFGGCAVLDLAVERHQSISAVAALPGYFFSTTPCQVAVPPILLAHNKGESRAWRSYMQANAAQLGAQESVHELRICTGQGHIAGLNSRALLQWFQENARPAAQLAAGGTAQSF